MRGARGDGRSASIVDIGLYLLGVVGMAASLTILFLSMRAVMDIGGACAEGGPFVPVQPCPENVPLLLVGSIFGLFVFGGLMVAKGAPLGTAFVGLVALAWPVLFISLGWNFLEYAFNPPDGSGEVVWGWLIPGVLFVLMGAAPLYLILRSGGGSTDTLAVNRLRSAARRTGRTAEITYGPETDDSASSGNPAEGSMATDRAPDDDLAGGLERLARLHDAGELSDAEYEDAKSALIRQAASGR